MDLARSTPSRSPSITSSSCRMQWELSSHDTGSVLSFLKHVAPSTVIRLIENYPSLHIGTSRAKHNQSSSSIMRKTSIGVSLVLKLCLRIVWYVLSIYVYEEARIAVETEQIAVRRHRMLWGTTLEELLERVADSADDFDLDMTQPRYSRDLATVRDSMWNECAPPCADMSKRRFQTAYIGTLIHQRLYVLLYARNGQAPHLDLGNDWDSPLGTMMRRKDAPIDFGFLGVLPAELFLMIINQLSTLNKTNLALTNPSFWKALDAHCLWRRGFWE